MLDNDLLEQLVTFADLGTVSATAKKLLVSQPSITRGLQKLEEELGVKLFDRQANKLSLTKTGTLAVQEARSLLQAQADFIKNLQAFDQKQNKIKITSVAPGPLLLLSERYSQPNQLSLPKEEDFIKSDQIQDLLERQQLDLVFSNQEIQTDKLESLYLGQEQLFVNLDPFTTLAAKQSLHFQDLKNMNFIVQEAIGIWRQIIEEAEIPGLKFLYQTDDQAFSVITSYSNFPYFTSNLTLALEPDRSKDRKVLPLMDERAKLDFYLTYPKKKKAKPANFIKEVQTIWPR